ncbi:MAG: hypothetical protein KA715_12620 [Xanthomonadaceae bacterium]|nr:hypothetical protein [Xanthomonadaceae bacterium]
MIKRMLGICVFALSAQLSFAQVDVVEIDRIYNPSRSELDSFINACADAEQSIEQNIRTIALNTGVNLDQLVVKKLIHSSYLFNGIFFGAPNISSLNHDGIMYACDVHFLGKPSAKVELDEVFKTKKHLKRKGYKKSEFGTACSDIEDQQSRLPNIIFQSTRIGWTLFQGHRCVVRSIYMNFTENP